MRNAVIGLFPGQVLQDKDSTKVETGTWEAADGTFPSPVPRGTHSLGQKPEQQNYAGHGNALAVGTIWLRVGRSDLSLPTEEKTEQVIDMRI